MTRLSVGLLAAAFCATFYGISAPFARPAAEAGVTGADVILWRTGVMALIFGLATWRSGKPFLPPRRIWPGLALFAFATCGVGVCYLSAVSRIPVGVTVLIVYTFPLVILVVSPFIDRRPPTLPQLVAFVMAFAGLLLALGPQWDALDPWGLLLAGGASLSATAQVFSGTRVAPKLDPMTFGFSSLLVSVPIAFAMSLASGGPPSPAAFLDAKWAMLVIAVAFVGGYTLQVYALRLAPASAVGLIFTVEPVVAIGTAALLLGERLGLYQYIGVALVLAALVVSVLPPPARRAVESA